MQTWYATDLKLKHYKNVINVAESRTNTAKKIENCKKVTSNGQNFLEVIEYAQKKFCETL